MKRAFSVCAALMIMVMAGPATAGEGGTCSASTQDCLNYMVKNLANRGWVGLEMNDEGGVDKMVVTRVVEGSPAEKAGFREGDVMFAVNGVAYAEENQKRLKDVKYSMKPGADFTFTVARRGKKIDLDVELGSIPEKVRAEWIGDHMMDHAELQMASNE